MLFHTGALWRLNQLGFLTKLDRVSSVSGGSITAAVLGIRWSDLEFDSAGIAQNFVCCCANPVMAFAEKTIDLKASILGFIWPSNAATITSSAY